MACARFCRARNQDAASAQPPREASSATRVPSASTYFVGVVGAVFGPGAGVFADRARGLVRRVVHADELVGQVERRRRPGQARAGAVEHHGEALTLGDLAEQGLELGEDGAELLALAVGQLLLERLRALLEVEHLLLQVAFLRGRHLVVHRGLLLGVRLDLGLQRVLFLLERLLLDVGHALQAGLGGLALFHFLDGALNVDIRGLELGVGDAADQGERGDGIAERHDDLRKRELFEKLAAPIAAFLRKHDVHVHRANAAGGAGIPRWARLFFASPA